MLVSWACTAMACKAAYPLGLIDRPKQQAHKNHGREVPVAGGIGMGVAWVLILAVGLLGSRAASTLLSEDIDAALPGIQSVFSVLLVIVASAMFLMIVGMLDDRKPMRAGLKFFFQFMAAGVTCWLGPRILSGHLPFILSWAISVFWLMLVINALNFFDNMDGLAGGTAAIATLFLLLIAIYRGQHFVAILAIATCGSACGFLMLNRPPAKIFMGDSGSHFLGYLLGVLCILTTFYVPGDSPTMMPILISLLVLGIPLLDAVTVVFIRLYLHKPIYVGDNRHISHRFVNMGLSRPQAVLLVCLLSMISGSAAISLLWLPWYGVIVVLIQMLAMFASYLLLQFFVSGDNAK